MGQEPPCGQELNRSLLNRSKMVGVHGCNIAMGTGQNQSQIMILHRIVTYFIQIVKSFYNILHIQLVMVFMVELLLSPSSHASTSYSIQNRTKIIYLALLLYDNNGRKGTLDEISTSIVNSFSKSQGPFRTSTLTSKFLVPLLMHTPDKNITFPLTVYYVH